MTEDHDARLDDIAAQLADAFDTDPTLVRADLAQLVRRHLGDGDVLEYQRAPHAVDVDGSEWPVSDHWHARAVILPPVDGLPPLAGLVLTYEQGRTDSPPDTVAGPFLFIATPPMMRAMGRVMNDAANDAAALAQQPRARRRG